MAHDAQKQFSIFGLCPWSNLLCCCRLLS